MAQRMQEYASVLEAAEGSAVNGIRLRHGTSTKYLPRIRKTGLRSERAYIPGEDGVFLTDDDEVLEQSTSVKTGEVGGDAAVCEVDADTQHLTADKNMYAIPTYGAMAAYDCDTGDLEKSDKCWKEGIKSGRIPYPKDVRDWETSLRVVHSVISVEPIPASRVKCRRL